MTCIFKKLCFVTILLISPLYLYAYDFQVDGLYYNINTSGSSVGVTNGDVLYQGKIEIPSEVLYNDKIYDVTNIGSFAFANCLDLTSVTIPNSVIAINSYAFSGCRGITSVNIPNSLKWIRTRAFQGCSSLTSVIIPNSVTFIDGSAFSGCSSLNSIMVDNGNSNYDSRDNCNAIIETSSNTLIFGCKKTVIPNSVTNIGNNAFSYCSGLTSLAIPDGVTSIGDEAFEGCSNLSSITIHDGVSTIGNSVFKGCTNLNSIILPNSVLSIGSQAFRECSSLKTIDIGNCVTSIGNQAFFGCRGINSFTIPNSVKKIDDYAFAYCSGLTTIKIPNSVTELGGYSFEECTNLTSVSISNSIKEIKLWTFYGCKNLKSVTIPNSVTTIGGNAFMHCTSLTSVDIPNSVTAIENGAFERCTGLVSVTLPNTVTTIAGGLFEGCSSLSSITIPSSINSIGRIAFYRCDALNSIISEIQEPFPLSAEMIFSDDTYSRAVLTVPKGTKAAYQSTEGWYKFRNIVEVGGVVDYTISITSKGNGSATYDGTTAKNNTQTITLKDGTSAIITFNPDNGYRIKYVKVNNTDVTSSVSNNQYTVSSISANTTVEVVFEAIPIPTYTLSITASGNGSVSYSGTNAKNNTKTFTVNEGTSVAIAFTPDTGYRIKSVKVNSTDVTSKVSNNSYTISSINANTTVDVVFEAIPVSSYTLKYIVDGETYKTYLIQEGATIIPEAMPTKEGYTFSGWSEIPQIMPSMDVTVVGTFTKNEPTIKTYTLTIHASGNGSAVYGLTTAKNNSQTITVNQGTSPTITFFPDNGYRIKSVKVNNTDVSSQVLNDNYTISGISADTTVEVEFEAIPVSSYTLKYVVDGETYKTYQVQEGAAIIPEAEPEKNGYTFSGWSDVPKVMPANDVTVTGTFIKNAPVIKYYTLSLKATGSGSVSYNGIVVENNTQAISIEEGVQAVVKFTPHDGYLIKSATMNGRQIADLSSMSFTIDIMDEDVTIEVEFEAIPVSSYTLKYVIDGETYKTFQIEEGTAISPEAEPTKEGYTFSGWSAIPATMPAKDMIITGSFIVNKYKLTYQVDGEEYKSYSIDYNAAITPEAEPTKDGYSFSGWSEIPATMPANDVTVTGSFAKKGPNISEQGKTYSIAGVNYEVVSTSDLSVVVATGDYKQTLEIPETITYGGYTWDVIGLKDGALDNCDDLAAIIWEPSVAFNARVKNPNLLLYVKSESYKSLGVRNVVVNGVADNIELTDAASGNDFYCPKAFIARNISYSHHYSMETGLGDAKGWETIVLPFDVKKYTSQKGEIVPFAKWTSTGTAKPFWLCELTANGYREVEGIKANTPYIISMPNNRQYQADYVITGIVTFSAENVEVKASADMQSATYQDRTLVPNYTNKNDENSFALNVKNYYVNNSSTDKDGSKFIKGLRSVHPFEAYMTTTSNTRSIDVFDGMTTAIREIVVETEGTELVKVYDTRGILMKTVMNTEDMRKGLAPGVYIVNGKKMIIK